MPLSALAKARSAETSTIAAVLAFAVWKEASAKGGKPPDGSAAWQAQQLMGAAVRANRSEVTVESASRDERPTFAVHDCRD